MRTQKSVKNLLILSLVIMLITFLGYVAIAQNGINWESGQICIPADTQLPPSYPLHPIYTMPIGSCERDKANPSKCVIGGCKGYSPHEKVVPGECKTPDSPTNISCTTDKKTAVFSLEVFVHDCHHKRDDNGNYTNPANCNCLTTSGLRDSEQVKDCSER